jgi:hypothetical protein
MDLLNRGSSPENKAVSPDTKQSPSKKEGDKKPPVEAPKVKKFLNGWTPELDDLMSEWADKAACYRWMHERTEKKFSTNNSWITIPVIILSTLTGTANFGLTSIFGDNQQNAHYATLAIGGVSLIAGIITTLGNFLRYAQGSEAHRVSSIAWGKFNRLITVELRLNPNERMDSMSFLKVCRIELDRLIEQSPPIPDDVIAAFRREFGTSIDVKKPDIAAPIEHTKAFKDNGARLKKMATEAAIMIAQKKGVLKQMVVSDIDIRIREENDRMKAELKPMLEAIAKKAAADTMRNLNLGSKAGTRESSPEPGPRLTTIQSQKAEEIRKELTAMTSSGVVSMLRSRLRPNALTGGMIGGGGALPLPFTFPTSAMTGGERSGGERGGEQSGGEQSGEESGEQSGGEQSGGEQSGEESGSGTEGEMDEKGAPEMITVVTDEGDEKKIIKM